MHPKSVPSIFLLEAGITARINDGKQQILLTNKLSELMVSQEDVWVFPWNLLYIYWGRFGTKYIVLGRHLVSTSLAV
jgi:hypothetical protein